MNAATDRSYPIIHRAGDQALLVEFGAGYSPLTSRAVLAFDAALQAVPAGVLETAPTVRSVLIRFDPLRLAPEELLEWCRNLLDSRNWYGTGVPDRGKHWVVPVIYGAGNGPDLDEAAELAGVSPLELIRLHTSVDLAVLCLGFSPGLAYLAELPKEFAIPRLSGFGKPVPAGSILIANRQTVLPATPIPTGWRQIGQTPFRSFFPDRAAPFLISPGDTVRFKAISENDAARFKQPQQAEEQHVGA